ncbi:hypothetical protein [Serratia fonticola]|uniref:hypothetical protein n=1 Tax=Serratia fonticola TaxID=47917 RepID=UPI002DBF6468|nr:hypothetical protein [Serratia fonticola]MEB7886659.1 hypothetical protein [Serratia fonticola]
MTVTAAKSVMAFRVLTVTVNLSRLTTAAMNLNAGHERTSKASIIHQAQPIGVITIMLASNQSQSARFFDSHTKAATINQCSVYIDRDDLETNVAGYKEYLIANNVVCNPDEFVYITRIPANHSTLVLFCDTTAQGDLRCSSRFQIDNQHDPLSGLRPAERQ